MIEPKDVEYVAWLARLDVSEEEKEKFTRQLGQVLEHAEKIKSLDTEDVDPTSHAIPLKNVMREDETGPCLSQEEALSGAPRTQGGYFVVPRII
ncbi:MAG: Asp-tRNA(Asn)/Glu-tRNA(Gln) amidotransferase subunit GatC [Actinobacteria bacterium]|jgi:aspartyl-tRNA(Asn)/glutamyl-tRNA(Gln) amidotransferase subunit C|nr:MAG: Asp-tRNA(Asn)/Glu-tRNA(Gln) amidotransferase subunit GatC [Actinomycetota bacterium]